MMIVQGLYYAKARYYDAENGRFVSEDSYRGEKGEILSHNLYIYGYNNPNRYVDFSGHNALDVISGIGDALDDGILFGAVKWIIDKALGKKFHWKNELHYYAGRIIGDVISMIHGIGKIIKAVAEIVGGLAGGGAVTVSSGGALSVAGTGIVVTGINAGLIEVAYGGTVITAAASNFGKDLVRFAELSRETGGAKYGDNFEKMGKYVRHPGIKIDWSKYAGHGFERLAQRGISKELAEEIVKNGKALSQNGGAKYAFVSPKGVVVVASDGKLVTAWSKNFFDEAMKKVVKKLFGK